MSDFRFDEHKPTALRHKITDKIRKAIFHGQLKPGDRLREVEVAKQMGVSRGPIREALHMLEQEGLLYSHPYKETMVAEISGEEVQRVLIPIRLTIELFAIEKALPQLDEEKCAALSDIIAEMKDGAARRQLHKVVDCDLAFHEYLVGLSNMPNLMGIWTSIYNRIRLHFIVQGQAYEDLHDLWQAHDRLLATIREGDRGRITEELTRHISDANFGLLS